MAPLPPLPSSPSLDYTLLRQFVPSEPSRFLLGPSFTDDPAPEDFPFSIKALCFWSSVSNVFLFKVGPFTPTLLNVAAIVGLRPHGITLSMAYNPDGVINFKAHLDLSDLAYTKFTRRFAGTEPFPIIQEEGVSDEDPTISLIPSSLHHLINGRWILSSRLNLCRKNSVKQSPLEYVPILLNHQHLPKNLRQRKKHADASIEKEKPASPASVDPISPEVTPQFIHIDSSSSHSSAGSSPPFSAKPIS
uniref:Uncharacterized protein n=1 Tax=Ananas comosus var. bracteatus TaxID=296719 RepID=A0A6V7NHX6_ANACO|nr:unnamed protein product [Ananas comosus var. bracteatus]